MTGLQLLPYIKAKGRNEKYSENFMKWVRKHREDTISVMFLHWSNIDGSEVNIQNGKTQPQQILVGTGVDHNGWFYGARLSDILCNGAKALNYAWPPKFKKTSLPNWIEGYIRGGKCFVDPEHRWYGNERWKLFANGESRECIWCNEITQHKHIKERIVADVCWVAEEAAEVKGEAA